MTIDDGLLDKEIDRILARKKPANDDFTPKSNPTIKQSGNNNIINNGILIGLHKNSSWFLLLFLIVLFGMLFFSKHS